MSTFTPPSSGQKTATNPFLADSSASFNEAPPSPLTRDEILAVFGSKQQIGSLEELVVQLSNEVHSLQQELKAVDLGRCLRRVYFSKVIIKQN